MTRVTPIVKSLNLETLEDRRTKSTIITINKALNYIFRDYRTRQKYVAVLR